MLSVLLLVINPPTNLLLRNKSIHMTSFCTYLSSCSLSHILINQMPKCFKSFWVFFTMVFVDWIFIKIVWMLLLFLCSFFHSSIHSFISCGGNDTFFYDLPFKIEHTTTTKLTDWIHNRFFYDITFKTKGISIFVHHPISSEFQYFLRTIRFAKRTIPLCEFWLDFFFFQKKLNFFNSTMAVKE